MKRNSFKKKKEKEKLFNLGSYLRRKVLILSLSLSLSLSLCVPACVFMSFFNVSDWCYGYSSNVFLWHGLFLIN